MSDKYIIRNCPAQDVLGEECCYFNQYAKCEDSDCVLKQIVEKCKNVECDCIVDKNKCGSMDNMPVCCDLWRRKDILSFFDIEEVE